jgi:hypothetical protein
MAYRSVAEYINNELSTRDRQKLRHFQKLTGLDDTAAIRCLQAQQWEEEAAVDEWNSEQARLASNIMVGTGKAVEEMQGNNISTLQWIRTVVSSLVVLGALAYFRPRVRMMIKDSVDTVMHLLLRCRRWQQSWWLAKHTVLKIKELLWDNEE